jgi:hypothetical protein
MKTYQAIILLAIVLLVVMISGCQQQQRKCPLPAPRQNWQQQYGDGAESRQDFCILALIKTVKSQAQAISALNARLIEPENQPETEGEKPDE